MESDSNDVQFSLRYKQAFDNDPNFTAESPQKHVEDEEIERQIVSCHTDFKKMEIVTKIQNKQKVIKQLLQKSLDHKVAALTLCKRFQTAFQNIPTQRLQIQQMINNWQEEELDTQGTDQTQLNQQIDLNEENIETIENEYNHELKGLNSTCSDFSCCLIKARFLKQLRKRWSPEFQDTINQFKVPQNISQEELALKFAQETSIGLYLLCMLSNTQYSPYEANLYQKESIKQICTGNNDICVHENVQVNKKFQTIIRQSYSYILKSETRQPPKNIIIDFSIINDAMQVIYPQVSYSSYQTLFSSLCGRELPFSLQDKLYEACHEIIKIAENALEQGYSMNQSCKVFRDIFQSPEQRQILENFIHQYEVDMQKALKREKDELKHSLDTQMRQSGKKTVTKHTIQSSFADEFEKLQQNPQFTTQFDKKDLLREQEIIQQQYLQEKTKSSRQQNYEPTFMKQENKQENKQPIIAEENKYTPFVQGTAIGSKNEYTITYDYPSYQSEESGLLTPMKKSPQKQKLTTQEAQDQDIILEQEQLQQISLQQIQQHTPIIEKVEKLNLQSQKRKGRKLNQSDIEEKQLGICNNTRSKKLKLNK